MNYIRTFIKYLPLKLLFFFSIIPCQNTKAYLHMCVNITCQNHLWLLVEHTHALIFWPCFMQTQHHFSSFLHPWHCHNHHLNCLPWMMYPLYACSFSSSLGNIVSHHGCHKLQKRNSIKYKSLWFLTTMHHTMLPTNSSLGHLIA